jgi:peptidoglycan/xylan/chitin deacetylase (PgdA/CDA1 family)
MSVQEARRTAALLFAAELAAGALRAARIEQAPVLEAVATRPVPWVGRRVLDDLARRRGEVGLTSTAPLETARRAVLGPAASGMPRVLIRVDEFPHYDVLADPGRFGTAAFRRFHERLAIAGVPYLIAALPALAAEPLDPRASGGRALDDAEADVLRELVGDESTALALHGFDHRTRHASPRRRSELTGLAASDLRALVDRGMGVLAELEIFPRVFVPPYNTFGPRQYDVLAERFDVVCGGPESVLRMGLHPPGQWRGEAVYLPSYAPLYGRAGEVRQALERLVARASPVWAPVTLHWEWESQDDFRQLDALLDALAPYVRPWSELLAEVDTSRRGVGAPAPREEIT